MKNIIPHFLLFTVLFFGFASLFYFYGKNIWYPYYKKHSYKETLTPQPIVPCDECTLTHVEPLQQPTIVQKECPEQKPTPPTEILSSKQKLKRHLADSDFIVYPNNLTLIGLKHEKVLEVWTKKNGKNIHITSYPFTAFSGILGPKVKEGDRQIPEGIYGISYLNPNSKYHLSMRINYPNAFDKRKAREEKRSNLGGDIMIHGNAVTVGCIPIGDDKIEELYFLAQKVGINNIKVILAPVDFRRMEVSINKKNKHPWLRELYTQIKKEMVTY
ncbi:MAG: Putative inner membrane protein [uncultured Sulfurovum sp.]|uniref:Inner membrane protein n=1 Tax=uncultured Sulfurovum sp. TaxID=269237 RepID=A0A6S6SB41_9BACT|nr:MAG: Putative inner membrane protein [uncultured Sulfurovum sp.]